MKPAMLLVLMLSLCANPMRAGAAGERDAKIAKLKSLLATHPRDPRVLLRLGEHYVFRADESQRPEHVTEARETLAQALDAGAGPEARAWLGLLRCVEAKYGSGATARAFATEGLRDLDQAVEQESDNLKFRLMRATVDLRVPREWKRLPQGKEDLLIAEAAARRDPAKLKRYDLDPAELYFKLGQAHLATGEIAEARGAWERARAAGAGKWSSEAERMLARHAQ